MVACRSATFTGRSATASPLRVGLADRLAAADAAAGQHGTEHVVPVVAAVVAVDLGRAAEFAEHGHERLVEQAALGQIGEQRRQGRVERRRQCRTWLKLSACVSQPPMRISTNLAPCSSIRRAARNMRATLPSPLGRRRLPRPWASSAAQSTVFSAGLCRKRLARMRKPREVGRGRGIDPRAEARVERLQRAEPAIDALFGQAVGQIEVGRDVIDVPHDERRNCWPR